MHAVKHQRLFLRKTSLVDHVSRLLSILLNCFITAIFFVLPASIEQNNPNTSPRFALPGDSSELDEIHHSARPFAPRQSEPSYPGTTPSPPSTTESTQQSHPHLSHPPPEDPLGPLPDNWEMAYTENGEVYFIE